MIKISDKNPHDIFNELSDPERRITQDFMKSAMKKLRPVMERIVQEEFQAFIDRKKAERLP